MSHIEARYPAILFKQQLTACVEKIFGLIRDNIKKELSPLLGSCIQVCIECWMLRRFGAKAKSQSCDYYLTLFALCLKYIDGCLQCKC